MPISRRQACRQLAAGAAAALVPRISAAGPEKPAFQLRYILASSMYGETDLDEILPEVEKAGSEVIDIWPRRHANQREQIEAMGHAAFRRLLERHGVRLGMTTRYDLGPFRLQDEIRFVDKFGGRLIVCGARGGEGRTLRDKVLSFVRKLEPHVMVAAEHGVTLGIENHGNSVIDSPDSIRYFAEFAKSPNLGIALAPYHLPQDEQLMARLIEDLGPKLVHFYAWEHGRGSREKLPKEQEMQQMPGYGPLDFNPLLAALRKIDYRGWTEIFMHPVPRGIPILDTTAEVTAAINRSRSYLEESLAAQGK